MRRAGLAAGLLVALAACSGGHRNVAPPTSGPPPTSTSTTLVDAASVQLPTVPGQVTQPPIAVSPGAASLSGTVVDDAGAPVGAATVSVQRIVGGQSAGTQVTTAPDGAWGLTGILGGVYRVRAWRPPDLAETTAKVVFVAATGANPALALVVSHFSGTSVQAAVSPNPPVVGAPVNVVVQVTSAAVGADGIVRQAPATGVAVAIDASGDWSVDGAASQVAGGTGRVAWQATCEAPGPQPVSVSVNGGDAVALSLPDCAAAPTTSTSPSASPSSTTTTTTLKR